MSLIEKKAKNTRYVESYSGRYVNRDSYIESCLNRPLGDDLQILPHPLLLGKSEWQKLRNSSKQRHLALQAFFADIILGDAEIFKANIDPNFDELLIKRIFWGNGKTIEKIRDIWKNKTREDITGWSGGDLVRDHLGHWRIIEDNLGNIEGRVTTPYVNEFFCKEQELEFPYQGNDLQLAIRQFLIDSGVENKSEQAIAIISQDGQRYLGNQRIRTILEEDQIPFVIADEMTEDLIERIESGQIKSVVNFNTWAWPGGKKALAKTFAKSPARFFECPYFKIVCDKALLQFMPAIIKFYLSEEVLLQNADSLLLLDYQLPDSLQDYVIKVTNDHSGNGIYIIDEMSDNEIEELRTKMQEWKTLSVEQAPLVIAQKRIYPSQICFSHPQLDENYQIEIRVPGFSCGWQKVIVNEQVTARAISLSSGDSRCHVVRGAFSVPVLISDEKLDAH